MANNQDYQFREVFLEPIRKCLDYEPAFGQGRGAGMSYAGFQQLYGGDPFYAWLGLDAPSVYAAHKAAGGLTSVYRQIGIGSERLFRAALAASFELSEQQMAWSYEYQKPDGKTGRHTLDAHVALSDLSAASAKRVETWLTQSVVAVRGDARSAGRLRGVVFEVRQGYKSADSKRQNADLRYGVRAYQAGLLPAFGIMSSQVSQPVLERYRNDGMLVLTGTNSNEPTTSTFAFFKHVVGYDLGDFFERNSIPLKAEIRAVIDKLLEP